MRKGTECWGFELRSSCQKLGMAMCVPISPGRCKIGAGGLGAQGAANLDRGQTSGSVGDPVLGEQGGE